MTFAETKCLEVAAKVADALGGYWIRNPDGKIPVRDGNYCLDLVYPRDTGSALYIQIKIPTGVGLKEESGDELAR